MRVLAVIARFKWQHIDYLLALAEHVELKVAWIEEIHEGAARHAAHRSLDMVRIGSGESAGPGLRALCHGWSPDVLHLMYYFQDELTVLARMLVPPGTAIVHECRDPSTTVLRAKRGTRIWNLEAAALAAADGCIFVSRAERDYLEYTHRIVLGPKSLLAPHAYPRSGAGPLRSKLSEEDGRVHIALLGSVDVAPDHGRWYGDIICRLVGAGFVVHSHFYELPDRPLDAYRALAAELPDFRFHPTISFQDGTKLSDAISRYDLMGVFYELDASFENASTTHEICMPAKAPCGWLYGALPAVTFARCRGLMEWIEDLGIGFGVRNWKDVAALARDREKIRSVTARCIEVRDMFSNEFQAERIAEFYGQCLGRARERTQAGFAESRVATFKR